MIGIHLPGPQIFLFVPVISVRWDRIGNLEEGAAAKASKELRQNIQIFI